MQSSSNKKYDFLFLKLFGTNEPEFTLFFIRAIGTLLNFIAHIVQCYTAAVGTGKLLLQITFSRNKHRYDISEGKRSNSYSQFHVELRMGNKTDVVEGGDNRGSGKEQKYQYTRKTPFASVLLLFSDSFNKRRIYIATLLASTYYAAMFPSFALSNPHTFAKELSN